MKKKPILNDSMTDEEYEDSYSKKLKVDMILRYVVTVVMIITLGLSLGAFFAQSDNGQPTPYIYLSIFAFIFAIAGLALGIVLMKRDAKWNGLILVFTIILFILAAILFITMLFIVVIQVTGGGA